MVSTIASKRKEGSNENLQPKFYVVLRKSLKMDISDEPKKNSSSYCYILTFFTPLHQHI